MSRRLHPQDLPAGAAVRSRRARLARVLPALWLGLCAFAAQAAAPLMELTVGHSGTVRIEEEIATAAIGNPDIAQTLVIRPDTLLINAAATGATSLTLFGKSGYQYDYRLLVSHDLTLLRQHLKQLDPRIEVAPDPNGGAVVLSGTVASKAVALNAEAAAIRFFADTTVTLRSTPRTIRESVTTTAHSEPQATATAAQTTSSRTTTTIVNAADGDSTLEQSMTGRAEVRVINLLMTEEVLQPPAQRLQALLGQVDGRIRVEQVNEVFVLKGRVATPAALSRTLGIADRFVSLEARPDIRVFSDQGGVLAGDLDAERAQGVEPVDPTLAVQRLNSNSNRNTGNRNGGASSGLKQPLHEGKGNLAQNIARGDVITAANGRVMSLLQVDDQPRVEIQMRIVAVDRSRTDELGIDWRLDGNKITIGSLHGGVVDILPSPDDWRGSSNGDDVINTGSANLIGLLTPGSYAIQAFIRAIEDKGAATILSEPLLTAVSGESSSFLVGGSIPIPQQTTTGSQNLNPQTETNVVFLDYGLKLIVRPTVLENGKISVVLDQSISEPDYARQIKLLGEPVPAFTQRTVSTVTEAQDGETWAVAGLITEEVSKKLREVPFISKVPVLGALFRNKTDRDIRSELMITVTARRVGGTAGTAANDVAEPPAAALTVPQQDGAS